MSKEMNYDKCYECPHSLTTYGEYHFKMGNQGIEKTNEAGLVIFCKLTGNSISIIECPKN